MGRFTNTLDLSDSGIDEKLRKPASVAVFDDVDVFCPYMDSIQQKSPYGRKGFWYDYFFEASESYGSNVYEPFNAVPSDQAGITAAAGQIERTLFRMAGT